MRTGEASRPVGADFHLIIVTCRPAVLAVRVDDRQQHAGLFHFPIGPAERAQQLGARDLEPDEVVGVVDDAHLIGLGVPHAQSS